jgi:diguanylate cyclase (GGDEF)-like protein
VDSKPQTVIVQCVKADSTVFKAQIEFSHAEVEGEDCTQVVIRDEHEQNNSDAELQLLRDRDFLTSLYNRVRFVDELEKAAGKAGTGKGDSALLYLVIDDFQSIKEKFGLGTSDLIIKEVADLLRKEVVDTDLIARYSDQVFTVIVSSDDDAYVEQRAETYRKVIANYVSQTGLNPVDLQCSIGISRISEKLSTVDAILNDADKACVQAQRAGGNQLMRSQATASDSAQPVTDGVSEWQSTLNDALKNNDFSLHFQPIVSLHGREQQLYEVLVRLFDQKGELLWPDKFFQYADHFDLMDELDKWVIENALQRLVAHQDKFPKTRFFIKLSKQTICKTDFVDWLSALLKANNLDGDNFVFEISETAALENLEHAKDTVTKLKELGCEFGLEHFGSGLDFSATLDSLDVDYLKINGTFVQNMAKDSENQAAVKAIIEMSKKAGKSSIAEFVSDANSLALLWRLGVDYAQGYYIHEPSEVLDYNFEDDDL